MLRSVISATLALVVSAILVPVAWGGILDGTVLPDGLAKGDPFRVVFVTDGTRTATSPDILVYDAWVQLQADNAGLETTYDTTSVSWKALASTVGGGKAIDQVGSSVPLFLLDGTRVSNGLTAGTFGSLLKPLNLSETFSTIGAEVWTGTNKVNGTTTGAFGLGFVDGVTHPSTVGLSSNKDLWIMKDGDNTRPNNTTALRLYAISNELQAVPEPGCLTLWALGMTVFGGVFFVRRRAASRATV